MRARIQLILKTSPSITAASLYTVWSVDPVSGLVLQHDETALVIGEIATLASAFDEAHPIRESIEFAGSRYEVRGSQNGKGDIFVVCVRRLSSLDRELGKERLAV